MMLSFRAIVDCYPVTPRECGQHHYTDTCSTGYAIMQPYNPLDRSLITPIQHKQHFDLRRKTNNFGNVSVVK